MYPTNSYMYIIVIAYRAIEWRLILCICKRTESNEMLYVFIEQIGPREAPVRSRTLHAYYYYRDYLLKSRM